MSEMRTVCKKFLLSRLLFTNENVRVGTNVVTAKAVPHSERLIYKRSCQLLAFSFRLSSAFSGARLQNGVFTD